MSEHEKCQPAMCVEPGHTLDGRPIVSSNHDHRALIEEAQNALVTVKTIPEAFVNNLGSLVSLVLRLAEALERRTTHPEWMSDAGKAFRERFIGSPDANTFTPLGFFEAGAEWSASAAERRVAELEKERDNLSYWLAAANKATELAESRSLDLARELEAAKTIVKAARHLVYCFLPGPGRCPMCGGGNGKGDGNGHCSTCALGALAAALAAGEGEKNP